MTKKQELFRRLDEIATYHPDVRPLKRDTVQDLLEKYFYWVSEYNEGYSNELANPNGSEFNAWIWRENECRKFM